MTVGISVSEGASEVMGSEYCAGLFSAGRNHRMIPIPRIRNVRQTRLHILKIIMGHMIFMTLIHAALNVESVGDDDVADWRSLPRLVPDRNDGGWHIPDRCPRIPLTFQSLQGKVLESFAARCHERHRQDILCAGCLCVTLRHLSIAQESKR